MVYVCDAEVTSVKVNSPNVQYSTEYVDAKFRYESENSFVGDDGVATVEPQSSEYHFRTKRTVPRTGVLVIGLGGNNGSTLVASLIANQTGTCWRTKEGVQTPNYFGSVTQASTTRLGSDPNGDELYVPLRALVPLVHPNDLVVHGWDINDANLADAMERAKVLPYDLQRQLAPKMSEIVPMPSIYVEDFIASNQRDRANNVKTGTKREQMEAVRQDIRDFKAKNNLDTVVVLCSATTERCVDVLEGLNDTTASLMASIDRDEMEVSPTTLFAVASILEGCAYINGSPQNTFVPGVVELAEQHNVLIGGDDFKSGQTRFKTMILGPLIDAGIKPVSICSYNHLGNNDGLNLSAPRTFRSKEVSKSGCIDDMVSSNGILYGEGKSHPDHVVVIKYVPQVGDSKRALDEYTAEIFMGGKSTINVYNVCEDSLLAVPIMIDLVLLTEYFTRVQWKHAEAAEYTTMNPVLSLLGYLLKAPLAPEKTTIVNSLIKQRAAIVNFMRATLSLAPESDLALEQRLHSRAELELARASRAACPTKSA